MRILLILALLAACACPSAKRPSNLYLTPFEECARLAAQFCRKTVVSANACEAILVAEFCTEGGYE